MAFWVDCPSFRLPLYKSFWKFIDFIFPPHCAGCDLLGDRFCTSCSDRVRIIDKNLCQKCGEPIINNSLHDSMICDQQLRDLIMIRAYALYEPPISYAIQKLKYDRDMGIAEVLANFLVELYNNNKMEIDMVIPVPLSPRRLKERGYNQADLLARPFSMIINKPLIKQSLRRSRDTRSQVGLDRQERSSNVAEAFVANPNLVQGKNIVLIDDVSTTGATLEACAAALKSVGANDIVGLSLARAVQTHRGFSDHLKDAETAQKT